MPAFYPLFVLTVTLLILTPGPNVALIVANSVAWGARYGLLTVLGTSLAVAAHMAVVLLGMGEALGALGAAMDWVRWLGVAYLLFLGVRTWREPAAPVDGTAPQPRSARGIVGRGLLVSLTNPKVLLFYGAFFPQFVAADRPVEPQLAVLCATYLVLAAGIDALWALGGARARGAIGRYGRLRNRIGGGLLVGAGVGLALARPK